MKKNIFIISLILLCLFAFSAAATPNYRLLKEGSAGDDVTAMKKRLQELDYYGDARLTDKYTDAVAEVVALFQMNNRLPETGEADAYTQAVLYSDAAVRKDGTPFDETAPLPEPGAGGDGRFRDLKEGAYGEDVLSLKEWMLYLNLYTSDNFNNKFNGSMADRLKEYQQANGFTADGTASAELQALLQSIAPTPTPKPTRTPRPTVAPTEEIALPELNEDGFMSDEAGEPFIHESFDDGHWYYIDQDLFIEICRYEDPNQTLVWYETEVKCSENVGMRSILAEGSKKPGHNFKDPMTLADDANAILAFTDDNYGFRWYRYHILKEKKYWQGVVIRDGVLQDDSEPPHEDYKIFPPLDVMAYYPDGRIELYYPEELTAEDYLEMGVEHTFVFGPILLRGGEINTRIYDEHAAGYEDYNVREPRQAIGYYGPGHYTILTVKGRAADSKGVTIDWLAQKMQEKGVSDAFNLDGGYTTVLYFMGECVNKKEGVRREGLREVSGVIAIGELAGE